MSNIAGFFSFPDTGLSLQEEEQLALSMLSSNSKRGMDSAKAWCLPYGAMGYGDLIYSHLQNRQLPSAQPLTLTHYEKAYSISFDGAITNVPELIGMLPKNRVTAQFLEGSSLSVEHTLLLCYLTYGPDFVSKLTGSFAMLLWDSSQHTLYLFRDSLGLQPLYYYYQNQQLVYGSHPSSLLAHPWVKPAMNREGLNELFAMGPGHSIGSTPFTNIYQVKPGHYLAFSQRGLQDVTYHHFNSELTKDSLEEITYQCGQMLKSSIALSGKGAIDPACLLSGGLDSSAVAAVLCRHKKPRTYSFDFLGSEHHFQSNAFQPTLDAPFVHEMVTALDTEHTTLMCSSREQVDYLSASVDAHGLPAMGDIDASLLYFCQKIAKQDSIIVTGECSDELFCGYPWYHKDRDLCTRHFPWTKDTTMRKAFLSDRLIKLLALDDYSHHAHSLALREFENETGISASSCTGEKALSRQHQLTMFLTIRYFMQTLVDRTDACAAACGIHARVPFASLPLAEYLFRVPYELQAMDNNPKHILREICKGLLPETVRTRKKSPYPKTYDPGYEAMLANELHKIMNNCNSPILELVDPQKVYAFLNQKSDYTKPWYGQLMATPQLMAYFIQIDYWLEKYQIQIQL